MRSEKYNFVFTLAIMLLCFTLAQIGSLNCCSRLLAKENVKDDKVQMSDWRKQSSMAAELIFYRKHAQGNAILAKILPLARREDPNGIDYGVCLTRYGYGLMGEKKYQQSLITLQEALKVIQKVPQTKRQRKASFQTLKAIATVYYELKQFDKAEKFARNAIAYRIAFPRTSSLDYFRRTYDLLRASLENQKKFDEAAIVAEISKNLS